jgi:hypothetical protein
MQVTQATTTSTLPSGASASDVTGAQTAPTDPKALPGADTAPADNSSAYTVTLSPAALAHTEVGQSSVLLDQMTNSENALHQATHKNEPKKMKTLLELMLEWAKKYEAEADARAKQKQQQPAAADQKSIVNPKSTAT